MPRARLFPPGPGLPGAHAGHGGPSARRLRIRTSIWLRNNRRLLRLTIGVMAILAFVAALRLRGAGRSPLGRPMPSPPGMAPAPRVSAPEAPPPGRAPVEPVSSAGTRHLTYILHSLSTQCSAAVARCSDALGVLLFSDPSQPILVPAPAPDFLQNQVPGWAAAAHYTDIALRRLAEWPDLGALAAGVAGGSGLRPAEVRVWTSWQQEFRPQTHVLLDLAPVAAAGGGGGAAAAARPDWRLRMELSDDMLHGPQVIEVSEEWTEATPGSGPLGPAPSRVETLWQRSSVGGPAFRSRPVGFRLVLAPSPVRPGAGLAAGLPLAAELAHSLGRLLAAVPSSPECGPVLCPRPVLSMADLHECFQADNEAAVFHAANCLAIIIDSSILHQLPGDLFDRAADWTRHGRRFYLPVGRSMALSRAEQAGRRRQEAEQPTSPVLCPPGDIAPCPHTLLLRTRERLTLPLLAVSFLDLNRLHRQPDPLAHRVPGGNPLEDWPVVEYLAQSLLEIGLRTVRPVERLLLLADQPLTVLAATDPAAGRQSAPYPPDGRWHRGVRVGRDMGPRSADIPRHSPCRPELQRLGFRLESSFSTGDIGAYADPSSVLARARECYFRLPRRPVAGDFIRILAPGDGPDGGPGPNAAWLFGSGVEIASGGHLFPLNRY
ncbi:hypothetical protein H696_04587 [Fonticula alba]|uniref:Uncharacterized protein n=1 Tax=Fonticula alba TaxID=691883 RepID=A0A058Z5F1_FONAL|nr:hypothetical protein H696_04587 [Fonticula alba]KCV69173.1 hypothetical protein H696_04587 [Fonticula alba]|eukprot:XP_009496744.1 hypothetical protein H696_04587 [Fonticula alba]